MNIKKVTARQSSAQTLKITLFCGGRGSATLIHELLRWPNIQLALIVNAYDDGLSTGALRGFVPEMLGPSDFRKNLSYLLDPFSEAQYALKNLLEHRLSNEITSLEINHLIEYVSDSKALCVNNEFSPLFKQLDDKIRQHIKSLLKVFIEYLKNSGQSFDFKNCSLGNLIFAGAYLKHTKNFNAAAKEMSQLVSSRGLLVNVSEGENRILVALKEDGELLFNEAQIVSQQSPVPIRKIFLVDAAITEHDWHLMQHKSVIEKEQWLDSHHSLPQLSKEASHAINQADIIIYGPGTQHSSLFPSYQIAGKALQQSITALKIFIMNLEPDYDIQKLNGSDLINRALFYLGDEDNQHRVVTHVFIDQLLSSYQYEKQLNGDQFKNIYLVKSTFANKINSKVHNGRAVVENIFSLYEKINNPDEPSSQIDIFIDIHKRSLALQLLIEEFLETAWDTNQLKPHLIVNNAHAAEIEMNSSIQTVNKVYNNSFPEIDYFMDWLKEKSSEYLVLLTGDGEYRFRDVLMGVLWLEQNDFGALFGSRTQSRMQLKTAIKAAYGERRLLRWLSLLAAFFLSGLFVCRFQIIFSDPLTGFRIFKRQALLHLKDQLLLEDIKVPAALVKFLIKNNIEIAELPVNYKTFVGFTDPYWRMKRGIKNILSMLWI